MKLEFVTSLVNDREEGEKVRQSDQQVWDKDEVVTSKGWDVGRRTEDGGGKVTLTRGTQVGV